MVAVVNCSVLCGFQGIIHNLYVVFDYRVGTDAAESSIAAHVESLLVPEVFVRRHAKPRAWWHQQHPANVQTAIHQCFVR